MSEFTMSVSKLTLLSKTGRDTEKRSKRWTPGHTGTYGKPNLELSVQLLYLNFSLEIEKKKIPNTLF